MNATGRFEKWASGFLAGVCLLLVANLVRQLQSEPGKSSRPRGVNSDSALLRSTRKVLSRVGDASRRREPALAERRYRAKRAASVGLTIGGRGNSALRQAVLAPPRRYRAKVAASAPAETRAATVAPPAPATTMLKPLGYVEKANGQIEAVVAEGDRVYLVHQGETFAEKYKVLKISSDAVEVANQSSKEASGRGGFTPPDVGGANPPLQALGYVRQADGRIETIVAEGQHVRLVPEEQTFASNPRVAEASPTVEVVDNSPQWGVASPDSDGQQSLPTGQIARPPSVTSDAQMVAVEHTDKSTEPSASLQADLPGDIQPMARPTSKAFELKAPQTIASATSQHLTVEKAAPLPPASGAVRLLGHVELADGQLKAILSDEDRVYLVREGEVFADRYRALKVSPFSVEIADELPAQGIALPALPVKLRLGQRAAAQPWGLTSHSPPLRPLQTAVAGQVHESSGSDPPRETGPPDKHPPPSQSAPKTGESKVPPTSAYSVPLRSSGQTSVSSVPALATLKHLGYLEMADGEVKGIVDNDGQVYLVREGEVFANKYRALRVSRSRVEVVAVSTEQVVQRFLPGQDARVGPASPSQLEDATSHSPPLETAHGVTAPSVVESSGSGVTLAGHEDGGTTGREAHLLTGEGLSGFGLHSPALMPDNPYIRR